MQLGRVMLLPANHLWDRITRIYNGYLSHHNFKIGLQVRGFLSAPCARLA